MQASQFVRDFGILRVQKALIPGIFCQYIERPFAPYPRCGRSCLLGDPDRGSSWTRFAFIKKIQFSRRKGTQTCAWQAGQCEVLKSRICLVPPVFFLLPTFFFGFLFRQILGAKLNHNNVTSQPSLSQEGVESIGAFLYHSKTMLVLWDPSYVGLPGRRKRCMTS